MHRIDWRLIDRGREIQIYREGFSASRLEKFSRVYKRRFTPALVLVLVCNIRPTEKFGDQLNRRGYCAMPGSERSRSADACSRIQKNKAVRQDHLLIFSICLSIRPNEFYLLS